MSGKGKSYSITQEKTIEAGRQTRKNGTRNQKTQGLASNIPNLK